MCRIPTKVPLRALTMVRYMDPQPVELPHQLVLSIRIGISAVICIVFGYLRWKVFSHILCTHFKFSSKEQRSSFEVADYTTVPDIILRISGLWKIVIGRGDTLLVGWHIYTLVPYYRAAEHSFWATGQDNCHCVGRPADTCSSTLSGKKDFARRRMFFRLAFLDFPY
jgi:hypothetical protein